MKTDLSAWPLNINDLKDEICGIKMSNVPPFWVSSVPSPEEQLIDLGQRGDFINCFEDYEKSEELEKLITGKRLAIVGPSPHLNGLGMGELIESYDLVIRINQHFPVPEHQWIDYGKRTDILFNCLNILKLRALGHSVSNHSEYLKSLKFILQPNLSMWDIERQENTVRAIYNNLGKDIPWQNVSDGYIFKVCRQVGTICNTGLIGLAVLLNYDVEEIYLTGYTFYNMGKFGKIYNDVYHDEAVKHKNIIMTENREPSPKKLRMDIHDQQSQIYFFKCLIDEYNQKGKEIIKLDDYLEENFINNFPHFQIRNLK